MRFQETHKKPTAEEYFSLSEKNSFDFKLYKKTGIAFLIHKEKVFEVKNIIECKNRKKYPLRVSFIAEENNKKCATFTMNGICSIDQKKLHNHRPEL